MELHEPLSKTIRCGISDDPVFLSGMTSVSMEHFYPKCPAGVCKDDTCKEEEEDKETSSTMNEEQNPRRKRASSLDGQLAFPRRQRKLAAKQTANLEDKRSTTNNSEALDFLVWPPTPGPPAPSPSSSTSAATAATPATTHESPQQQPQQQYLRVNGNNNNASKLVNISSPSPPSIPPAGPRRNPSIPKSRLNPSAKPFTTKMQSLGLRYTPESRDGGPNHSSNDTYSYYYHHGYHNGDYIPVNPMGLHPNLPSASIPESAPRGNAYRIPPPPPQPLGAVPMQPSPFYYSSGYPVHPSYYPKWPFYPESGPVPVMAPYPYPQGPPAAPPMAEDAWNELCFFGVPECDCVKLCRHWCHHAACKYKGYCKYRHVVPMTSELSQVGLVNHSQWMYESAVHILDLITFCKGDIMGYLRRYNPGMYDIIEVLIERNNPWKGTIRIHPPQCEIRNMPGPAGPVWEWIDEEAKERAGGVPPPDLDPNFHCGGILGTKPVEGGRDARDWIDGHQAKDGQKKNKRHKKGWKDGGQGAQYYHNNGATEADRNGAHGVVGREPPRQPQPQRQPQRQPQKQPQKQPANTTEWQQRADYHRNFLAMKAREQEEAQTFMANKSPICV
ncbi:hypothetical protein F5X99DRAFT_36222 [Biscogniauxia marginata]|nr:hypothetical protein F5X99DRAFT_36222 [Biscogniauxia marginata]